MKKEIKLTAVTLIAIAGAIGIAQACDGCGCSAKKEAKTTKTECASGVCSLTDASTNSVKKMEHKHGELKNLSTKEMKAAVASGKYVVLDARGGKYFDGTLIQGAKQLASNSDDAAIAAALPNKEVSIITYCSNTQCPASGMLAEKLIKLGYHHVSEYPEGIAGWKAAGGAVDKAM